MTTRSTSRRRASALSTQLVAIALALVTVRYVPALLHRMPAAAWRGEGGDSSALPDRAEPLARDVARWVRSVDASSFETGSTRFDGEWWFGTYAMAALGLGQLAEAATGPRLREDMDRALDGLLGEGARAFDRQAWGEDPLDSLDGDRGHAAYLGYANLALSLRRKLAAGDRYAEVGDAVTEALARRLEASPSGLLETYPGEVYPVDNAAVVASIALYDDVEGRPRRPVVEAWLARLERAWIDPETGLLAQSMDASHRAFLDGPRGSGTALAAYFLSFVEMRASERLYRAMRTSLYDEVLGFGVMREFPDSRSDGRADIDSGPVVFGYGVSATGFALGAARVHGDDERFDRLFATASLFGAPRSVRDGRETFLSGGPLGNAILLAMITARPR